MLYPTFAISSAGDAMNTSVLFGKALAAYIRCRTNGALWQRSKEYALDWSNEILLYGTGYVMRLVPIERVTHE